MRLELYSVPTQTRQSLEDAGQTGANPAKKQERPAFWAAFAAVCALAYRTLEVKRPDLVRGALDADVGTSSIIFGVIATGLCVFAIRRSVSRALPGIALTALYWAMLVVTWR